MRVFFEIFYNLFGNHLSLETPEGIFNRFIRIYDNVSHFLFSPPIGRKCSAAAPCSSPRLCPNLFQSGQIVIKTLPEAKSKLDALGLLLASGKLNNNHYSATATDFSAFFSRLMPPI